MVLEHVVLDVIAGREAEYEAAFEEASPLIEATPGYIRHTLSRCIETPNRYVLLVEWETLEAHLTGFRQSDRFPQWRALLHHFYAPAPLVEHFTQVYPDRPATADTG
jgi:heme-degrading monooxygenase HmoA